MDTDSEDMIVDQVVSTAERIEEMNDADSLEPLDIKFTVNMRGTVTEAIAVLTVGGPYIEVNLSNGTVHGSWGGDTHTTHVRNEDVLEVLEDRYTRQFEEVVLA